MKPMEIFLCDCNCFGTTSPKAEGSATTTTKTATTTTTKKPAKTTTITVFQIV